MCAQFSVVKRCLINNMAVFSVLFSRNQNETLKNVYINDRLQYLFNISLYNLTNGNWQPTEQIHLSLETPATFFYVQNIFNHDRL